MKSWIVRSAAYGFTLIELILAMAVIATLAAIAQASYRSILDEVNIKAISTP